MHCQVFRKCTQEERSSAYCLWHLSHEGLDLEDPANEAPINVEGFLELGVSPQQAPDEPTEITIHFENGKPTALNGETMDSVALIEALNKVGGANGIGILDIVENRLVGMKSRGVYEARGGTILYDLWGLKAPETVQKEMVDGDEAYQVVSLEALPDYTGDYILYGVLSDTDPDFVTDSAIWNNLPAVQAKRVLPYRQVAFMHRDPISLNGQLDELYAFLTGKEVQE